MLRPTARLKPITGRITAIPTSGEQRGANAAVCRLCRKIYRPGLHFSLASQRPRTALWRVADGDSIVNYITTNQTTLRSL
ncbi:hypothetical protein KCP74_14965 [Salmonella enterica subsp. enterica]|nr:hypothetical protein KCP74_14965 [Salmonella enterica subsp. enterica]